MKVLTAVISVLIGVVIAGLFLTYQVQVKTIPGTGCADASPGAALCVSLPTYVDNYGAPLPIAQGEHVSGFSKLSNVKVNLVAGIADVLIYSVIVFGLLTDIKSRRQKKNPRKATK